MREVGYAMAQLRRASGFGADPEWLNDTILRLYPSAVDRTDGYAGPISVPRLLRHRRLLDDIEQGKHDSVRKGHAWLGGGPSVVAEQLRGNPIPGWLVRAYDQALGADGYLIDLYRWAVVLDEAHSKAPPRWHGALPIRTPAAELWDALVAGFEATDTDSIRVLAAHQEHLVRRSEVGHADDETSWLPDESDSSALDDPDGAEPPEGMVMRPGEATVVRWGFRNNGSVPWRHRVLLHIADPAEGGLVAPPYLAMPDLDPGQAAVVACPIRAPRHPGTYRACFKMAWPDGVFCYPTTLLGVLVTIIVPRPEIAEGWQVWPVDQNANPRSTGVRNSDPGSGR